LRIDLALLSGQLCIELGERLIELPVQSLAALVRSQGASRWRGLGSAALLRTG
jgi:hypothetical protein